MTATVVATLGYEAKRAVYDRLAMAAVPGGALEGVQVSYEAPAQLERRSMYLGGFRTVQDEAMAEVGLLRAERVRVALVVRVAEPFETVREAEQVAEALANVVAGELARDPNMAGRLTWTGIGGGASDYAKTEEGPVVTAGYHLDLTGFAGCSP